MAPRRAQRFQGARRDRCKELRERKRQRPGGPWALEEKGFKKWGAGTAAATPLGSVAREAWRGPGCPSAPWRHPKHPGLRSPQLRAPGPRPGAASVQGVPDWGSRLQEHRWVQLGPAEAEQGRGGGCLLLPGRTKRMKPVIRVRASRGEAGGGSGPSRNGNWGVFRLLGIPHPPPAPLPCASTPRPARIPAPGCTGSWAGPRARLHRSAKTRSANRAAGAGTWSRGARCCWRGVLAPGRLCFFSKRNQIRSWPVVGHPVSSERFPDWSVRRFPCHPWRGLRFEKCHRLCLLHIWIWGRCGKASEGTVWGPTLKETEMSLCL